MAARYAHGRPGSAVVCRWKNVRAIRVGLVASIRGRAPGGDYRRGGAAPDGAFRSAHPQIPWAPIMAQRHRLAHEYDKIKNELIWDVATAHVPKLIQQIEPLIPPLPPDDA